MARFWRFQAFSLFIDVFITAFLFEYCQTFSLYTGLYTRSSTHTAAVFFFFFFIGKGRVHLKVKSQDIENLRCPLRE